MKKGGHIKGQKGRDLSEILFYFIWRYASMCATVGRVLVNIETRGGVYVREDVRVHDKVL